MATYNPSVLHDVVVQDHEENRVTHIPDLTHQLTEAAIREGSLTGLFVLMKMLLGAVLASGILLSLGHPGVVVFSAFAAGIGMLYMAGLLDVSRVRDALVLLVPVVFVSGLLLMDHRNVLLVGLALFTHVCTAFFAGVSKTSGSIQSLGLWSFLFGMNVSAAVIFAGLYLL